MLKSLGPIGLRPLFRPEVCDLFADTVLKPHPLLLQSPCNNKFSTGVTI